MRSLSSLIRLGAFLMASGLALASADAQQLEKVSIGLTSSSLPGGTARYVKQMGLFEKHGLDASVIPMDNSGCRPSTTRSVSLVPLASMPTAVRGCRAVAKVFVNIMEWPFRTMI